MTNLILVFLILSNLLLLGSGRISANIRIIVVQGIAISLLPLLVHAAGFGWRSVLLAAGTAGLKVYLFPRLLNRAQKQAFVHYETSPYLSFSASILLGVIAVGASILIGGGLHLPDVSSPLLVPAGMSTVCIGLILIVARKKALSQVLGYLVLDNGVFVLGVILARHEPLLFESGIALDVLVAVCLFGITIFHISREYEHIDVDQMTTLRH